MRLLQSELIVQSVLNRGKSADVPQNPKILSTVSTCCESAGRWAAAQNLFESSLQMHVRLDQIHGMQLSSPDVLGHSINIKSTFNQLQAV